MNNNNLSVDSKLLQQVIEAGTLTSNDSSVNLALKEFIQKRKQLEIIELFGTMDPDIEPYSKKLRDR
ncbi:MAG: type II toxin-antitoxin system VapB family antitoxin [Lentisphaeraceae bacterium]|nr:type II toxin-antitoxin system VapB family antitoxin [Lentisphaeraceae bacterium]